jgi:hypothetical protein
MTIHVGVYDAHNGARYWPGQPVVRPTWPYDMWSCGVVWLELLLGSPDVFQVPARTRALLHHRLHFDARPQVRNPSLSLAYIRVFFCFVYCPCLCVAWHCYINNTMTMFSCFVFCSCLCVAWHCYINDTMTCIALTPLYHSCARSPEWPRTLPETLMNATLSTYSSV